MATNNISIEKYSTSDTLAQAIADNIISKLSAAQKINGGTASIVLTGGSMGIQPLSYIATSPNKNQVDWSKIDFWWGDERFEPENSDLRNALQAWEALLSKIDVDKTRVHEIEAADKVKTVENSAEDYAQQLITASGASANDPLEKQIPIFDLILLGEGPDSHIASIFPGSQQTQVTDVLTYAVTDSPKPPSQRVTMTYPVLNASPEIWFLVAGSQKAQAVKNGLTQQDHYTQYPAAGAHGTQKTIWFIDSDAATEIPEDFKSVTTTH